MNGEGLFAVAVARGCGTRQKGGIYVEVGMGPGGKPLEHFLLDPPIAVPPNLAVPERGMALFTDAEGVTHLLDRVGEGYYPNVADFLEEVRRFGLSRRVQKSIDFSKLGPQSRILIIHPRAIPTDPGAIRPYLEQPPKGYHCPKHDESDETAIHPDGGCLCAGLWWEDVTGGTAVMDMPGDARVLRGRRVERTIASTTYIGWARPRGTEGDYVEGFVASFPVGRLAIVKGDVPEDTAPAEAAARKATLRVDIVDE